MGSLIESIDWTTTPIGAIETWSQSLRTSLSICLLSRFPIFIWWGPELVMLYNDAYRPILGSTKHPKAMGQCGQECWAEIWDVIGPMLNSVMTTGEATWSDNQPLFLDRNGYLEECYFTFSYSPIIDETGDVGGVFTAVTETTAEVIQKRRLQTLRDLASQTAVAKTVKQACEIAAETLSRNLACIPFALLYLIEGDRAQLVATAGIEAETAASPLQIDLTQDDSLWQFKQVQTGGDAVKIDLLEFENLPTGAWTDAPNSAIVLPLAQGFLVAAISPRRALDDEYCGFFDMVAKHIETAIANARTYEEERQRAEALAELDRAKTVFFSNVSHEFRTPLTLMLSPLEDALSDLDAPLPEVMRSRITLAQRNGLRLQKLVNTLLDFSRIEAGRIQAVYEPTDLATLTAELASVFRSLIERADMSLVVDCPRLPEAIYVEREMWEKIVFNLLSNAFKFTLSGSITVRLQWESNRAILTVKDTGIGIEQTEILHLFERFHRVKVAQGRSFEGSGIGLSLVLELVKLHGGTIEVTSVVGQGSCFTVSIPSGTAHLPSSLIGAKRTQTSTALGAIYVEEALRWLPDDRTSPSDPFEEAWIPRFETKATTERSRILLADDNADMREYVKQLLLKRYDVQTVADGNAALAAIRNGAPDLVLTDVMMPGMDGFELLRELRSDPNTGEIPIILISARAGEESRIEGIEAGADDYLIKPFSARELLARVEASLKLAQLRQIAAQQELSLLAELEQRANQLEEVNEELSQAFEELQVTEEELRVQNEELKIARLVTETERQRYQDLFNLAPDGYVVTDGNGLIQEANQAISALLAYEPNAQMPRPLAVYIADSDRRAFRNFIFELHTSPQPQSCELSLKPLRGNPFPAAITAVAICAPQKQVVGIRWLIRDITARKQAEANLQASEERLSFAQHAVHAGIWDWDMMTDTAVCSEAYYELHGFDPEPPLVYDRWMAAILPEDRSRIERLVRQTIEQRTELNLEFRVHHPVRGVRWLNAIGQVYYDANSQAERISGITLDITDRKRAEAALRESEERFRNMADNAPVMVWVTDPTGYCTYLSKSWYDFSGQTEETGLGFGWLDVVHPEDSEDSKNIFLAANTSHEAFRLEYRLRRFDGEYRTCIDAASPWFGVDGQFKGYIGSVIDITDRKRAEAALRESDRRFRRLVESNLFGVVFGDCLGNLHYANDYLLNLIGYTLEEMQSGIVRWDELTPPEFTPLDERAIAQLTTQGVCAPYEKVYLHKNGRRIPILLAAAMLEEPYNENQEVVVFILDLTELKRVTEERDRFFNLSLDMMAIANTDGYLIQVNPAWERTLGFSAEELIDQPYVEFVHPDDRAATIAEALKLAMGQETTGFENRYRTKDGSYRWLSWNVSVAPNSQLLYAVARDISDRRQAEIDLRESEARYRMLAEAIPQFVFVTTADGQNEYVNQQFCQYTGLSLEQMRGNDWLTILHPDDVEPTQTRWMESVNRGTFYQIEYRFRRFDGSYRWFLGQGIPLKDEQGRIQKWFGTCTDIDQQKQLEVERMRLFEQEQVAREQAEQANRIKDEFLAVLSHELRSPLNPILGWSRLLQQGKLDAAKTTQALATIERNAKLQVQLIDDLLDISRILRGKLSLTVAPVNLATVILAAKETVNLAAEAKSVQIQTIFSPGVGLVNGDAGRLQQVVWNLLSNAVKFTPAGEQISVELTQVGTRAQIQVKDNGKGIDPDFLPYVFDHFRQEDGATTRKFGGLGLGLAIARQLVEMHGGTVQADSPGEGKGATFTVQIPLAAQFVEMPSPTQSPQSTVDLSGIQILVVDDELDSREFTAFVLQQAGAIVNSVSSGTDALDAIAQSIPDILISDIGMPLMDGYMLMRQIRGLTANMPAIALTAYAGELDRQQAHEAGFQRHLTKPIEPDAIVAAVIELVGSKTSPLRSPT